MSGWVCDSFLLECVMGFSAFCPMTFENTGKKNREIVSYREEFSVSHTHWIWQHISKMYFIFAGRNSSWQVNVKTFVLRTSVYFGTELTALHSPESRTVIMVLTDQLQIVSQETFFSSPCLVPYYSTTTSIPASKSLTAASNTHRHVVCTKYSYYNARHTYRKYLTGQKPEAQTVKTFTDWKKVKSDLFFTRAISKSCGLWRNC
jgi:hypothetical protein